MENYGENNLIVESIKNKIHEIVYKAGGFVDDAKERRENPGAIHDEKSGFYIGEEEVKKLMYEFGDVTFLDGTKDMVTLRQLVSELQSFDKENTYAQKLYGKDATWEGIGNTLIHSLMQKKDRGYFEDLMKRVENF